MAVERIRAGSGSGLYDGITGFAGAAPGWLRGLFTLYTEVGLLIFGALFLVVWWRARRGGDPGAVAPTLLAPVATVVAYVVSELLKTVFDAERPCRGLPAGATVVTCPEVGDWSFPSNHSTIAAAAAVGLILVSRGLAPWVVGLAVAMAFSRVFVGAHYPHDVLAGLTLGAVVAWLLVRVLTAPVGALVTRFTGHPVLGRLLAATPPAPSDAPTRVIERAPADERTVRLPAQDTPRRPGRAPQPQRPHPAPRPPAQRPHPDRHPRPTQHQPHPPQHFPPHPRHPQDDTTRQHDPGR
ncbi:phosphatase PAP2 family protein [Saccharothrix algeriensis]|uniref:Undecaprenyl-diphosphatase n=1 Tax=Saccharothrix algeriensis TaxID=173560 RepID=A0ABS2S230_9PSEU|nr:phosphatase PAP2 family protein [Saccharothrix algeriensis]MBM7810298.1 undecaprenyl-diphosphatase [Saccharothrix algeriensis]